MWLSRTTDWWKLLHLPDVGWWQLLTAAVCLVVLIWAIVRLVARVNDDVDPAEADKEMLQAIDDLRREGDLSEDEFRSIKSQLVSRLSTSFQSGSRASKSAKAAERPGLEVNRRDVTLIDEGKESGTTPANRLPLQPEQSESFASPTNVPGSTQNTSHLSAGIMASESENTEGIAEQDSDTNNKTKN